MPVVALPDSSARTPLGLTPPVPRERLLWVMLTQAPTPLTPGTLGRHRVGGGPGSTGHLFTAMARGLGLTLGPQCLDVAWLLLQWASAWLPQPEHSGKGTDGTSQVLSSPTGTQEGPLFHSQGNLLGG